MELLIGLGLLAVAALPVAYGLYRSNELFRLQVRAGRVSLVRGRLPHALLSDLEDVFARTTTNVEVRVVKENQRPRVIVTGADADLAQRVRNVVGRFQVAHIRSGGRVAGR